MTLVEVPFVSHFVRRLAQATALVKYPFAFLMNMSTASIIHRTSSHASMMEGLASVHGPQHHEPLIALCV
jgi:hypothetical protein